MMCTQNSICEWKSILTREHFCSACTNVVCEQGAVCLALFTHRLNSPYSRSVLLNTRLSEVAPCKKWQVAVAVSLTRILFGLRILLCALTEQKCSLIKGRSHCEASLGKCRQHNHCFPMGQHTCRLLISSCCTACCSGSFWACIKVKIKNKIKNNLN